MNINPGEHLQRRQLRQALAVALAFGAVMLAYFWNLGVSVAWGDEADTLNFSRNLLQHGLPYGYDGRNFLVYQNCASISSSLLSKKIPWLQYYVGAASLKVFGDGAGSGRLVFACIGALTFFPLYSLLRKISRWPALIASLSLVSPQFVLFERSARYYPLLTFLFVVLIWAYQHPFKKAGARSAIILICSLLLFQTHQLAAFCMVGAVCFYSFLVRDRDRSFHVLALLVGLLSWVVFDSLLGTSPGDGYSSVKYLLRNRESWGFVYFLGTVVSLLDLDLLNSLPLLGWYGVGILALRKELRQRIREAFVNPLARILVIGLTFQIVGTVSVVGLETADGISGHSALRYFPNLVGLMPILFLLAVEQLASLGPAGNKGIRRRPESMTDDFSLPRTSLQGGAVPLARFEKSRMGICWVPLLLVACVSTNLLTLSFWLPMLPERPHRVSWWIPVYGEIVKPPVDPLLEVVARLEREPPVLDAVVRVLPRYLNEVFTYYVGRKYLIHPDVKAGSACADAIRKIAGPEALARTFALPEWIIVVGDEREVVPGGYTAEVFPFARGAPDYPRPELSRHGFESDKGGSPGRITVYRHSAADQVTQGPS